MKGDMKMRTHMLIMRFTRTIMERMEDMDRQEKMLMRRNMIVMMTFSCYIM